MKREREVWDKINELSKKLSKVKRNGRRAEEIMCNIDALLWVIGDESGKPI